MSCFGDLRINAEVILRVRHMLLAVPGTQRSRGAPGEVPPAGLGAVPSAILAAMACRLNRLSTPPAAPAIWREHG